MNAGMNTRRGGSRGLVATIAVAVTAVIGVFLAGCAPEAAPRDPVPAVAPAPGPAPDPTAAPDSDVTQRQLILASLAHEDAVAVIDPNRADADAVVQRITVGAAPWGVGVNEAGTVGYAATAEGLGVIDLTTGDRTALVPYLHQTTAISYGEYRAGGLGLAVAPDGARVYVAVTSGDGEYFLEVFDVASGMFVDAVPVGARPFDVLVAPDSSWAASVDHDSFTVTVVDAGTLAAEQYTVAPFGTVGGLASWEKGHYGAVTEAGEIVLPYQGLTVALLDPHTGEFTTVPSHANSHSHGTALAGDTLLTVGTGAFGTATGTPNLSILNLAAATAGSADAERIVDLRVPHETVTPWQDADGRRYAAIGGGDTREAGWDGITLVDLESLALRELPVPGYPQVVVSFTQTVE